MLEGWFNLGAALWPDIGWHWPWAALVGVLPWLGLLWQRLRWLQTHHYADAHLRPWVSVPPPRNAEQRLRFMLEAIAWMLLAVALAGPHRPTTQNHDQAELSLDRQGMHLAVVLQVSDSMRSTDIAPTRLERALLSLHDLTRQLRGEEVSLIAYGAQAGLLLPATHDTTLLSRALSSSDLDLLPTGTSRLSSALALALQQVDTTSAQTHALLLITDADSTSLAGAEGQAVEQFVAVLRERGIPLFIVFVEGAPSLGADASPTASTARSGLGQENPGFDPAAYQALWQDTGGRPHFLANTPSGLRALYEQDLSRIALPAVSTPSHLQRWQPWVSWPIGLAFGLLLLAYSPWSAIAKGLRFISRRLPKAARRSWRPDAWALLLLPWLLVPSGAEAQSPGHPQDSHGLEQRAWQALEQQQWNTALRLYGQLGGHRGHWGAGMAALRLGDAPLARDHFGWSWLLAPTHTERLNAQYNLAHAHAALGRWDAAAQAWKAVLTERPDDQASATNYRIALEQVQQQQLLRGRTQDLYGRRGHAAEGYIEPQGATSPKELDSPDLGVNSTGNTFPGETGSAPASATGAPFATDPQHLHSGLLKLDRLEEHRQQLQKGLFRQEAAQLRPPRSPSPATGNRP